jgi:hypothetical protein
MARLTRLVDTASALTGLPMPATGRLFPCACCRAQVVVCSRCDRGQVYGGGDCSQASRRARLREAGQRCQLSRRGRMAHAERTRRYRQRLNKVTRQRSPTPVADARLPLTSTTTATASTSTVAAPGSYLVPQYLVIHGRVCARKSVESGRVRSAWGVIAGMLIAR